MYNARDSDPFSFFQIAGIHGIPFAEWGQTGGRNGATGWAGYCPHGEDIFLPWHRPYVALYEQVMVKKAREIAETYPDTVRDQYRRAADSLRSPFWDWATDNRVPVATTTEKVTIKGVRDGQVREMSVNNPLWTYVFPKDFADGKYEQKPRDGERVLRCTAPFSYPATANANIQRQGYRQQLYDLFTRTTDFASFGSVSRKGTSLEMLHNHIHWDAGCDHTFVQPSTSGFDPLFWLHHTNVDRLWAYWTAIKPEQKTMNYEYVGKARFSTPENSTITIDSPLQPFFNEHGEWHTTASVSELDSFGYSYEGLEYWRKSPEEMQRDATSLINNLYGPRGRNGKRADGGPPKTRLFASVTVDASQLATRPCAVEVSISGYKSGSIIVLPHPEKGEVYGGFSLDEAMASRGLAMASISKKVSALQQQIEVNIVKVSATKQHWAEPS